MDRDLLVPEPLSTPHGTVAFFDETWSVDPRELQIFFQAEEVYWTADRTIGQWRRLLACSRLLTARLVPEGHRGGRLVGATRLWSDHAYEAKLYDVVTARDLMGLGVATELVKWALRHPWTGEVQRFVLETRDAANFYPRFGFRLGQEVDSFHMRVGIAELEQRGLR
ncbi:MULTISPECIES: GNAT family N-acetyltransferase [Geothrix]|uniref:GNAT family N-acetyltransferase n=1 Tax=Geothrix TaxID=44675 RepID=UPI001FADD710|nr:MULTISPECIES: GNAT family N-acetyltransferase [Geothrix]